MNIPRSTTAVLSAAVVGLAVAACGSSSGASTTTTTAAPAASTTAPAAASTSAAASAPAAGSPAATIDLRSTALGRILTDATGRTLYLWEADRGGRSACTGACANAWPPVTTNGTPRAGAGVSAGKLGTVKRAGGQLQVTYDGHPLYRFAGDTAPGQTAGEGSTGFGALWYVVSPAGAAVTAAAGSGSTTTMSSSAAGY